MPAFSYSYIEEYGFKRPKIPIIISSGEIKTEVAGLVDSGTDFVMFPKAVADAVGIKLSKKTEKAEGVGGKINCKSGLATIALQKRNNKR